MFYKIFYLNKINNQGHEPSPYIETILMGAVQKAVMTCKK